MKRDRVAKSNKWSVTFEAPGEIAAEGLSVVGDFNGWNPEEDPMKQRKNGVWARTVRLLPGTYRFRYVSDQGTWYNDPAADGYEPSGLGGDNCLLILKAE
jgi:1,4-alpha-glucan branching enzyme